MSYIVAIVLTLVGWIVGLFLDGNLTNGDMVGILELRILFPIIIMGLCILRDNKTK